MRPHANLAVRIDEPLVPRRAKSSFLLKTMKSIVGVILSDAVKVAVLGVCLLVCVSLVFRSSLLRDRVVNTWKMLQGAALRLADRLLPKTEGVPMEFTEEDGGWGRCTLQSKRSLGKTSFVQYDFDLPKSELTLPLQMGQQVSLSCLDSSDSIAKGDFYVYLGDRSRRTGTFSILAPQRNSDDEDGDMGFDEANFIRVLREDKFVNDELALRPGPSKLEYRGQFLPVTKMIFIAYGVGIVPILQQLKAVLPEGSSSVVQVDVLWVAETRDDFDIIEDQLEAEFLKYPSKLRVQMKVDNLRFNTLADNSKIESAIPDFSPGTMAVLSGPSGVSLRSRSYLVQRGYPDDCICIL